MEIALLFVALVSFATGGIVEYNKNHPAHNGAKELCIKDKAESGDQSVEFERCWKPVETKNEVRRSN
jgi:hypothetical protein